MSGKERSTTSKGKKLNHQKLQQTIKTINYIQSNSNDTIKWTKNYIIRLQL